MDFREGLFNHCETIDPGYFVSSSVNKLHPFSDALLDPFPSQCPL